MISNDEIFIYNLTKEAIPSPNFFQRIIKKTLKLLNERKKITLSLIFINSRQSRQLNNHWRNKNKATTVLSFPLSDNVLSNLTKNEKMLGDIFLCPAEIKKQAKEYNIPRNFFYKKLIIHSLLHLYGYTHKKKEDKLNMENLENKILLNIK